MNTDLLAILFTIGGVGVAIIAVLISFLLSMRVWRREHREDIQKMETKWDANLKAMETKWETNLIHWDDKWERLITLFINQAKEK